MAIEIMRRDLWVPDDLAARIKDYNPRSELGKYVKDCFAYLPAEMAGELLARVSRCVVVESALSIKVFRGRDGVRWHALYHGDRRLPDFKVEDYGIVGRKVITTAGVNFLVDAWQNSLELENLKYHGIGTGSTAEAVGDTALVTELTTEYTGNVRATGSLTEGASANIFRTVGTNTLDGTPGAALREHGIFDQAATGGGTLWDRTVYAAITLSSGDALQSTMDVTASAGG